MFLLSSYALLSLLSILGWASGDLWQAGKTKFWFASLADLGLGHRRKLGGYSLPNLIQPSQIRVTFG